MYAIIHDTNGWIRTRYNGDAPTSDHDWIDVPDEDWPTFSFPDNDNMAIGAKLFYRPSMDINEPPEEFNDEPGPPDWHPQSTATIGGDTYTFIEE